MLDYIPDDGYTENAFIKGVDRIHGDFSFSYRPFLPAEQSRLTSAAERMSAEEFDRTAAGMLVKKLTGWSLRDAKGVAVPITVDNILRLKPQLYGRVYRILIGSSPSDVDPSSASTDQPLSGEAQAVADAKN